MTLNESKKPKMSVLFSNDTFIKPFHTFFNKYFEVSWSPIPYTPPPIGVMGYLSFPYRLITKKLKTLRAISKADIIFVEFADETLALVSRWKKEKILVTRLHRYELFNLPKARWDSVDSIIVVNNWMGEKVGQKLPQIIKKITCIPNFIDLDYWKRNDRKTKTNQISIVGNIIPRKGHDKAIVAFSEVLKEKKDLFLNIIGRPKDVTFFYNLKLLVEELGIKERVRFKGFSDDLRKDFQMSDIILSFSEHESTHLTLFEGLSCGAWPLSINWDGVDEFLPKENIFSDNSGFVDKVKSFYSDDIDQIRGKVYSLAESTLVKFTTPDPRIQMSELIMKIYTSHLENK